MTDRQDAAEAPLDPATERVRRKMVRLLAVSVGIMLVGVMAVLAAVVYRTSEGDGSRLAPGASVAIAVPAGEIVSTALDGNLLAITVALAGGGTELVVADRTTGAVVSRHPLAQP